MNVRTTEKSPEHTFPKPHHAPEDTSNSVLRAPMRRSNQRESKNVLQLRLQQRRTREQLADQGIMPPLKSPAAFHEQRKSLERSKTGDYLKHKIRNRPEKSDLVKMRILPDSAASEGSATHRETPTKLKRARLADDLNEKIALRPGPLELVEKNIIPADSTVKEAAMRVNHGKFPKQEDSYAFEEDSSSESLSPDQPLSDESQGSACPLSETKGNVSPSSSSSLTSPPQGSHSSDAVNHGQEESALESNSKQSTPPIPVPAIVKPPKTSDKNRHKKPKDIKPKVKKLKYHQYIPPDQKAEKSPPPMDSAYARLLQQQQLFLQLQILSQQKHHQQHHQQHAQCPQQQQHQHQHQPQQHQSQSFSYQPLHQQQGNSEQLSTCSSSAPTSTVSSSSSSPVKTTYCSPTTVNPVKPGPLPPNLDDLKVSELRQQLRIRGLPVSGTKTALIERLRPFRDPISGSPSQPGDITTVTFPVTPTGSLSSYQSPSSSSAMSHGGGYYPFCSTSSTPPISPASSDLSVSGSLPDSFSDVTMSSPQFGLQASPGHLSADEGLAVGLGGGGNNGNGCHGIGSGGAGGGKGGSGLDAEKDKMLVEKQKVIEELTWKLHQEQRQVEELRMQLHKRKRAHGMQDQTPPPPPPPPQTAGQPPLPQGPSTPLGPHHNQQQPPHGLNLHAPPNPNQMQHFYPNVSVKQEHVASSCPLASKAMKNGSGAGRGNNNSSSSCMEGIGHCGMMGAPPRCPEAPPSRSPSGLSAFLSPQCSPQDSPGAKTSGSPQPNSLSSSPSHTYMVHPHAIVRDGCAHAQASTRPRNMQIQQKNVGQSLSCPYPPDQRVLQGIYSSPTEVNERASKAKSPHMQPKMAVMHSPRHPGPKCPITSTAFCSSEPAAASKIKQPPCYEDAVKQQLTRSQQMDEILDVLIESGVSAGSASGIAVHKFHRHYGGHMSPSQMPFEHGVSHGDCHLEALLSSSMGRQGDIVLLKIGSEEGQGEEAGDGGGGFASSHQDDKMLGNRDMMDTPLSPMATKVSPVPTDGQGLGMTFAESPWETMEWLDLTPPSSATAFNTMPPTGPSIFNTEFLDVTDINLNSAMDLHLEHW
ncbi:myocardin isoform X2 [Alosa alosa]|uniref:myocardin isoform X2 n=1 Tax=Alosa alosa TaxID=278164 RepID=UPI002015524D|nr:myocardin isoform X2 [Alosa alosa]